MDAASLSRDASPAFDRARIASARRSLGVLLALAVLLPAGCEALFARQARRLDALAARGRAAAGEVTRATSTVTAYRYEVDGRSLAGESPRERAPLPVGAPVAVRYLPEEPSFSRPTGDARVVAQELASHRSFTAKFVAAVGLFFLGVAAMNLRELRRLLRGVDPRSDAALRARRNETLVFGGALVVAVGLGHAGDATARGESLVPVALGAVLSAAVLLGTAAWLTKDGAAGLPNRQARLWRWLVPAAAALAVLRLLAWVVLR